jgi:outer membrane protein assembly factor BamE (lipoprotein component of BamABCDE complex)
MAGGATVARRYRGESRPGTPLYTMAMTRPFPSRTVRRSILAGCALPLILAGCQPIVANRGNMLDEDRITQVKAGSSSKNDVFEALGSPSIVSTFDDNTWYYIGQRTEREAFFKPVITDRKVIAVQFDDTDHVKTVDRVGLEEAVEVEPLEQTTPAVGRDITFMEQLIGNIGRPSSKKKKKGDDDDSGGG